MTDRPLLLAAGLVATAAGLDTVLRGQRSFAGVTDAGGPEVESETRFYGGVYLGLGLTLLSLSQRERPDPAALPALAGTVFLGGLARAGAWRATGPPHPAQRALLAVELGAPLAALLWRRRTGRPST